MKSNRLCPHASLVVALFAFAALAVPALGDVKTDLAKELTGLVFPREKLIQMMAHQLSEETRGAALDAMQRQFDYSRVERAVVPIYAGAFSADELRQVVAFHRTTAGRNVQAAVAERTPGAEQLPTRRESPPGDTHSTRLVLAEQLASMMMTKELMLDAMRTILADEPAEKRQQVLVQIEQAFSDPEQVRRLHLAKAHQLVPVVTTEELRQVVAFYSTPAGKKLVENNVRVGKAATQAAMQEAVRVSEAVRDESQRDLRRLLESQRNR